MKGSFQAERHPEVGTVRELPLSLLTLLTTLLDRLAALAVDEPTLLEGWRTSLAARQ